jgi:cytochrome oxidase Cu insertion factor (SCO1/SenC/PrrC family)
MRIRILLVSLFVLGGLLPRAEAMQEREVIDLSARGPQVGETIPDFTLQDQYGATWTRDSLQGDNGTMLVFIRSADW